MSLPETYGPTFVGITSRSFEGHRPVCVSCGECAAKVLLPVLVRFNTERHRSYIWGKVSITIPPAQVIEKSRV